jgi:uncharacterized protein YbjT (DUF2867 family)
VSGDRVLVTGATGYVGRRLVPRLVAAGYVVRVLVRDPGAGMPDGVDVAVGDLTDPGSLPSACEDVGVVVNLAAVTADRKPPPGGYDAVNADGVASLAVAAHEAGVARFVQMGGIDTGGADPGPYLRGRRRGEQAIRDSGVPLALLQPSIMFGGADCAFVSALARLVRLAPVVPVPGDGRLALQLVWVEDVCRCLELLVASAELVGSFPVGGPEQLTYDEVLDVIGEGLGRGGVRKLHLPIGLMRPQAALMQVLPHPPLTPAALELFDADNVATPDAIERLFGFAPRSFRAHVREHGLFA